MRLLSASLAPLLLLVLLSPLVRAAVLAIDYGAEFTKLSLVKPGVPFDVVLDRDSKRKIQSVVGWKRDDRVFGQEGKMSATRFPESHFPYVKSLLGRTALPSLDVYPSPPTVSPDGTTLIFPHPSPPSHISPAPSSPSEAWTPTALLAHQLSYFHGLAEELASTPGSNTPERITQVIVTVPAWWDQSQRRAYRDALELQGLTCLAMIGEGTGVALNFAMTRSFPDYDPATGKGTKEYHLVYDSGAMSTTATVVAFYQTSYYPTSKSKSPINTTHIEVVGTGWAEQAGGVVLDLAVKELLLKDFVAKKGLPEVVQDKRAMAKLGREAVRVKQILSANQESNVGIESLYNDVDYRSRLSRTDLEAAIAPTSSLFSRPITEALESARLTLDDISSVILFGGNTRVPFVQSAIRDALGGNDDKIAQNVNADEAAVLGAAYYGAALSRQFKMKSIEIHERSFAPVTWKKAGSDVEEVVFEKGAFLGQRKGLEVDVSGGAVKGETVFEFQQGGKPILSVQILNLPEALANFTSPSPMLNLTVRWDPRGHLATANAVLVSNATDPSATGGIGGALKGLFGKKDQATVEGEEEVDAEDGAESGKSEKEKKKEKEKKVEKVALKFREKHLGVRALTGEEKRTAMARLTSIASYESAKFAREEARNRLEGYLYRLSALLSPDADNRALQDYASRDEQDSLKKLLEQTFEWLGKHAEKADEKSLKAKLVALENLEKPIILRFTEHQTRGKAVEDFQQAMFAARAFFVEAQKNNTEAIEAQKAATPEKPVAPPKYTEDEMKSFEQMLKDNEVWMDEKMSVQVTLEEDLTKDPVILSKDLDERGKKLQMTALRLMNKKAPRAPRPSTSSSASTESSTTATASTSTSAEAGEETEKSGPPKHVEL